MSALGALPPLVLLLMLAGCAGTRVRVTDASTGAAIPGAHLAVDDQRGDELSSTTADGDGVARIAVTGAASLVYISADGYRLRGIPTRSLSTSGTTALTLQPAWLGAFMDGGVHRDFATGESHDGTPPRCHCHDAR